MDGRRSPPAPPSAARPRTRDWPTAWTADPSAPAPQPSSSSSSSAAAWPAPSHPPSSSWSDPTHTDAHAYDRRPWVEHADDPRQSYATSDRRADPAPPAAQWSLRAPAPQPHAYGSERTDRWSATDYGGGGGGGDGSSGGGGGGWDRPGAVAGWSEHDPRAHAWADDRRGAYSGRWTAAAPPKGGDDRWAGGGGGGYGGAREGALEYGSSTTADHSGYPPRTSSSDSRLPSTPSSNIATPTPAAVEHAPPPAPPAPAPPKPTTDPSRHVIFLGLDQGMEEIDLFNFLKVSAAEPESTTIIRDKATGFSKGYGFALFKTLDDSAAFIASCFPYVLLPFGTSAPRRVKVDYASTTGPLGSGGGGISRAPAPSWGGEANDGMRDIASGSSGASRVLLLRGVNVRTRWSDVRRAIEEVDVSKGMVRRVVGVGGKEKGGSHWGFGFVELRSTEAARALLAHLMSPTAFPQGFTFPPSAVPVSITFASPLSFHPSTPAPAPLPSSSSSGAGAAAPSVPETIPAGGPGGLGDLPEEIPVKYWDDRASVKCEWVDGWQAADKAAGKLAAFLKQATGPGKGSLAPASAAAAQGKTDEGRGMLKRREKDAMVPIAIKLGGGASAVAKGSAKTADKASKSVFGAGQDESDDGAESGEASTATAKGKLYKVPPMATSKKVATSISKWNTTQKELAVADAPGAPGPAGGGVFQPSAGSANSALSHHHPHLQQQQQQQARSLPTAAHSTPRSANVDPSPPPAAPTPSTSAPPTAAADADAADEFAYADAKKTACLLCQRQLKSLDLLRKHNAASELHKRNLADATLRQLAKDRVAAATAAHASEYRDRAAERRVAFNQPDKAPSSSSSGPSGSTATGGGSGGGGVKRKFVEGPTPDPPKAPAEPVLAPAEDTTNVGNRLLAKMGWSAGQGLGLQGEGRVDPVQAQMLAARAGLGAVKPTPPAQQQQQKQKQPWGGSGWDDYTQKARDSARDRYAGP